MGKTVLVTDACFRADKEAAAAMVFLNLENAELITSQVISINGGLY